MPLRKTKSRRRPKVSADRTERPSKCKEKSNVESQEGTEGPVANRLDEDSPTLNPESSMDEEERRARETIALLAKKYQVNSEDRGSTNSLDIIRVDESEATPSVLSGGTRGERAVVEKENRELQDSPRSSRRPKLVLQRAALKKPAPRGKSPVFKVPKPLHSHSTPAGGGTDSRLFGFDELDSPLTLSPVSSTPTHLPRPSSSFQSSERSALTKPSPYSRLKGTYDIPFKKKTPRRQPGRRKERRQSSSVAERWAQKLNKEFTAVEQFELAVE